MSLHKRREKAGGKLDAIKLHRATQAIANFRRRGLPNRGLRGV